MPNNKHLTLDNRITIESMLNTQSSFKEIAVLLNKNPSTISKEVRSHLVFRHVGAMRTPYNSCALRFQCKKVIFALFAMQYVNILSAKDVTCAMLSAKISKKKSVPNL